MTDGSRYFWEARYVSTTFDASPKCLIEIDRMLRNEEGVLRAFTVKHKSSLFRCSSKNYKNPYFETLAASAEDDSTEEDSTEEDSTEEYSTEEYNTDDDSTEEDSAEKNSM